MTGRPPPTRRRGGSPRSTRSTLTRTHPTATLVLLLTLLGVLATSAAPTLAQDVEPTSIPGRDEQPDVIVLMLDDMAYLPGERVLERLPNIKRLFLDGGKRFTEAYNEIPLCCPARANFHSGQHSLTNGIVVNTWFGFDNSRTLATAMDEAGYHTLFLGKYMNDYEGSTVPAGWDKAHIDRGHHVKNPQSWVNGTLKTFKGRFFDDVTREQAVKWLKRAPESEPVFELISPYAPHRHKNRCANDKLTCTLTPAVMEQDEGAEECRGVGRFKPPSYTTSTENDPYPTRMPDAWEDGWPLQRTCESLLVMDRMVGELEAAQAERGRPAYFVLMSDNGMSWGQHGFPLKHVPWATRLPLYVSGPGVATDRTAAGVSIIDIPVTIADIAGASMPWADGESFLPVLEGETEQHRTEILELMPAPPADSGLRYRGWEAIRRDGWRYIRWDGGERELYDHSTDPWETDDRIDVEPGLAAELDARLDVLVEESRGRTP